ncbi:MAG: hypothetical protein IPN18_02480 [Ignavibacteriales bacterium]|nr:hypothetical protein [Ignavibacteriales bacterium]
MISYDENINTNAILIEDYDGNGVPEIAYPYGNIVKFFEFRQTSLFAPTLISAKSIDDTSVQIKFLGLGSKHYIYRGTAENNIALFDSTNLMDYIDTRVTLGSSYYYQIGSISGNNSAKSKVFVVYHHSPARFVSSSIKTDRSVEVKYSSKVKKEIDDPSKIYLITGGEKVPLSSYTPSGENSFLLTFPRKFSPGGNMVITGDLWIIMVLPFQKILSVSAIPLNRENNNFILRILQFLIIIQLQLLLILKLIWQPRQ